MPSSSQPRDQTRIFYFFSCIDRRVLSCLHHLGGPGKEEGVKLLGITPKASPLDPAPWLMSGCGGGLWGAVRGGCQACGLCWGWEACPLGLPSPAPQKAPHTTVVLKYTSIG